MATPTSTGNAGQEKEASMPNGRGIVVRTFTAEDAAAVADLIRTTLLVSNASDYSGEVLQGLADWYSPAGLVGRIPFAHRLVAEASGGGGAAGSGEASEAGGGIVGTAAYREDHVEGFFVSPAWQGCGVGARLLAALEDAARRDGVTELRLESSLTAIAFYARHGFVATSGPADHGDGLVLQMRKAL